MDRSPRVRQWVKRLVLIAAGVVGAVSALALAAYIVLTSRWGSERLGSWAEDRVSAAIEGSADARRVRWSITRIHLDSVELVDPDGRVVAHAESVEARYDLWPLLRRTVRLEELVIRRPRVEVSGALRSLKTPPREREPARERRSPWRFEVKRLVLRDGQVREGEPGGVEVRRLSAVGEVQAGAGRGTLEVEGAGQLVAPVGAPLRFALSLDRGDTGWSASVSASSDQSRLVAALAQSAPDRLEARVTELVLAPDLGTRLLGGYPLSVPLRAAGTLEGEIRQAALDVRLSAALARGHLVGTLDLKALRADALALELAGLDFSELIPNGPRSQLRARVTAEGTLRSPASGRVSVQIPRGTIEGQRIGPVRAALRIAQARLTHAELHASLPGAEVRAIGRGSPQQVALRGRIEATDLGVLGRTAGRLIAPELGLAGSGSANFQLSGPLESPSLRAAGTFSGLRWSQGRVDVNGQAAVHPEPVEGARRERLRVDDLAFSLRLADVRRPLDARLRLLARGVHAGTASLRTLRAEVSAERPAYALDAWMEGTPTASISARGQLDPTREALTLSALEVRLPRARWQLAAPARLAIGPGRVRVEGLRLHAGPQRIALDGTLADGSFSAHARVEALSLAQLPLELFMPRPQVGGRLDAEIDARGRRGAPAELTGVAQIRAGRWGELSGIAVALDAHGARRRLSGTVRASAREATLQARFDLPLAWPRGSGGAPIALDAELRGVGPGIARTLLENWDVPWSAGRLDGNVALAGTSAAPRARARVTGRAVRLGQLPALDFSLELVPTEDRTLTAQLAVMRLGRHSEATLQTRLRPEDLLERPDPAVLVRAPMTLRARFVELPLSLLAPGQELAGAATGELDLRGSLAQPIGRGRVELSRVSVRRSPPLDARLDFDGSEQAVDVRLQVRRQRQVLAEGRGRLSRGIGALASGAPLTAAPLELQAALRPMALTELARWLERAGALSRLAERWPKGTVDGELRAQGTLAEPALRLNANVVLRASNAPESGGRVQVDWRGRSARYRLELSDPGGQRLSATGAFDLSAPALLQGASLRSVPFHASVQARAFDPGFLSPLIQQVEALAGPVSLDLEVSGRVGDPRVRGLVHWNKGRLAVRGTSELKDIDLLLRAEGTRWVVEALTLSSGNGRARLTGVANPAQGGLAIRAQAALEDFPIVGQGRLLATATLRAGIRGTARWKLLELEQIEVPEARITLPAVSARRVQMLQPAEDVVFLRRGEPVAVGQRGAPPRAADEPYRGMRIRAQLSAPRNVWVRSDDFSAEVGLNPGFRAEVDRHLAVFGELRVLRGELNVLERRFELVRGSTLAFNGVPSLPTLDVRAEHRSRIEPVVVEIALRGPPKELEIEVTSDPPLPESQILTVLATGRPTFRPSTSGITAGDAAASLVGSVATSRLRELLVEQLPLDVLSVEAGGLGREGASVEAGTYLSPNLYLGFQARIGAIPQRDENSTAVLLEYQLSPRWSLDATYGDAAVGGVDLLWSKEY